MAKPNVPIWAIGCLFTVLVLPRSASADLIGVTGGFLFVPSPLGDAVEGPIQLVGERGFSLTGFVAVPDGSYDADTCNTLPHCTPGSAVSLDAIWSGTALGGDLTFEGQTFEGINRFEPGRPGAHLEFTGSFIAPPLASSAVVTSPFTLTGIFSFPGETSGEVFGHDLIGSGIATINLTPFWGPEPDVLAWRVDSVRYDVTAPIPEPGTLLLAGLGIAGVARRVIRARASAP